MGLCQGNQVHYYYSPSLAVLLSGSSNPSYSSVMVWLPALDIVSSSQLAILVLPDGQNPSNQSKKEGQEWRSVNGTALVFSHF